MVFLFFVALYSVSIPWCGAWDPWETHYGEVARRMTIRHDPLELWWTAGRHGPDKHYESLFASKHVLPFWAMALSLEIFQVGTSRDPSELVFSPTAELALRLPSMMVGFSCIAFSAYVVRRLDSGRCAGLTACVLATMPLFAIISRQALTDMFLAGPVVLAWGAWAMAWFQPDRPLRRRANRPFSLPWDRAYTGFLVLFLLAVIVPLGVLQHHVLADHTIRRISRFVEKPGVPTVATLEQIAWHLLPYWGIVLAVLTWSTRWKTRRQAWLGIVYVACGMAVMGKGILGPGLVGTMILLDCWVAGRPRRLVHAGLGIGCLLFVASCFPWHHAMSIYRGERWARELIFDNNLARFSSGEQKQAVGTSMFYLRTLGLAAFPWSALLPLVAWRCARWLRTPPSSRTRSDAADGTLAKSVHASGMELRRFATLSLIVTLLTITYSATKYYHYILPVLPPLAVVIGLWLGEPAPVLSRAGKVVGLALCLMSGSLVIRELVLTPAWIAHLTTVYYKGVWLKGAPATDVAGWIGLPAAIGAALLLWNKRRAGVASLLLSATLFTGYVLNIYLPQASGSWSQRDMFRHYFNHRDQDDRLVSWWLYHRGETYFSKGRIWMSVRPRKKELVEYIIKSHNEERAVWILTAQSARARLTKTIPRDLRDSVEVAYENAHHVLLWLPWAQPSLPSH